jgi:hypothetical protein
MNSQAVKDKFKRMRAAYQNLFLGSMELLELDSLFRTEKGLLKLVNALSQKRIQRLNAILSQDRTEADNIVLRANMLEAQAVAALGGHQLGEWEELEGSAGFQAACTDCDGSVFVSASTLYSILADTCPAQTENSLDDSW